VREVSIALIVMPRLGEAEVEHLHFSLGRHHHIRGFEIPVDNPVLVRGFQTFGDLASVIQGVVDGDRVLLDSLSQCLTLGQLHHKEALSVVFLKAVQGGNVLMAQRSEQLGFPLKPSKSLGILCYRFRQHLHRYAPIEVLIMCPIDLTHPTLADFLDDAVVAKGATNEVSHCQGSQRGYGIAACGRPTRSW
jgi:hypothetical protein